MDKAFALQRLKFRLNPDVMANLVHEVGECGSNFIVSYVNVTALCTVRLKFAPHAHVIGFVFSSYPYLK